MNTFIPVESIDELKKLSDDSPVECYIRLNGGLRSSKTITYYKDDNTFYICNEIDDSEQELTEEELFTESNIGEAITKGALYLYE